MTKQRILNQLEVPYGIDGIGGGAPVGSATPQDADASAANVGSSTSSSRQDHKHRVPTAIANSIVPGAAAAIGSSNSLARADHTHGVPAFGTTAGTFCQGNDSRLLTALQQAALAGTQGTPSGSNKFVTDQDPRLATTLFVYSTIGMSGAYTSWASMYAALSAASGVRYVLIDSDGGSPANIPAGTYDLRDVIIVGSSAAGGNSVLTISDGVILTGARNFQGRLTVSCGALSPVITLGAGDVLFQGAGVLFNGSGSDFIRVSGSATIRSAGAMDGDTFPIVKVDASTDLILVMEDGFLDYGFSLDGDASATLHAVYADARATFASANGFGGTIYYRYELPRLSAPVGATATPLTGDVNDMAPFSYDDAAWPIDGGVANRTITGIDATLVKDQVVVLINVGSTELIFTNEDSGSLAVNRFLTSSSQPVIISPQGTLQVWYDRSVSRWRMIGTSAGGGGGSLETVGTSTDYSALTTDDYIGVTDTSANRVVTLPPVASVTAGKPYVVKDESGAAGVVGEIRVKPNGSELLDGLNTFKAIDTAYGSLSVVMRAGKWWTT